MHMSWEHVLSEDVEKFVFAAERLMVSDLTRETLSEADVKAIRYYVECISDKFLPPLTASLPT